MRVWFVQQVEMGLERLVEGARLSCVQELWEGWLWLLVGAFVVRWGYLEGLMKGCEISEISYG